MASYVYTRQNVLDPTFQICTVDVCQLDLDKAVKKNDVTCQKDPGASQKAFPEHI